MACGVDAVAAGIRRELGGHLAQRAGRREVGEPETDSTRDRCTEAVGLLDDRATAHRHTPDIREDLQQRIALRAAADGIDPVDRRAGLPEGPDAGEEVVPDALQDGAHEVLPRVMAADADEGATGIGVPEGRALTEEIGEEVEVLDVEIATGLAGQTRGLGVRGIGGERLGDPLDGRAARLHRRGRHERAGNEIHDEVPRHT